MHPSRQNSEVGPLLQQVSCLSLGFIDFSFGYSSTTCNNLAHECVKLVSHSNLVEEWFVPPPCQWGIIEAD